ncbi:MAG TPA: DUF5331 domain-containing protein [Candidatus Obscuribacterales bacterium]
MAFFKDFSVALKDKWLQYYQANRDWLVLQMDLNSIPTPDGGRRPASSLILGTINALDPEAAQLMLPFSRLNPDPEKLIEVLGLHFDPDLALGGRSTSEQSTTVAVPAYQAPAVSPGYAPSPEIPLSVAKAVPGYHPPAPPETPSLEEDITPAQTLNVAGAVAVAGAAAVVGGAVVMEETLDEFDLEVEEDISIDDDLDMGDLDTDLDEDLDLDIDTETATAAEEDFDLGLEDESESLGTDDLDMSLESDELESDDLDMSLESDELESDDLDMSLESDELESDDLDMSLESDELESDDLDFGLESETTSAELDINTESDVWDDEVQTELGEDDGSADLDLSLDSSDDIGLGGMDDFGLEGDDLGSDEIGGLELGDTDSGLDDDLGDFGLEDSSSDGLGLDAGGNLDDLGLGDDDLGEFNLDDMGDLTTGDMDDIDIEGLTGSSDDDEISLSDFK